MFKLPVKRHIPIARHRLKKSTKSLAFKKYR